MVSGPNSGVGHRKGETMDPQTELEILTIEAAAAQANVLARKLESMAADMRLRARKTKTKAK